MKQHIAAPMAVGGALVTGVSAMILGGYRITDCFQYRTMRGECDTVVEGNVLSLVAGGAAIAGSIGGFFTYNRRLERPEELGAEPVPVTPPAPPVPPPAPEPAWKQEERELVAFGLIDPLPAPPPPPEPEPEPLSEDEALDIEIHLLRDKDYNQKEIANLLEISLYRVRKALNSDKDKEAKT